jgi:hypothetical protein
MVFSKMVAAIPCQSNGVSGKVATVLHYNIQFVILDNLFAFGGIQTIIMKKHKINNTENNL